MSPDYSKGKIYKIYSPECDAVYIGSTTRQYLCQRLAKHNCDYIRWFNGLDCSWYSSFLILGFGNVKIELIEEYPCKSRDELSRREREIIEETPNCLNVNTPILSPEEASEYKRQYVKEWYSRNREYRRQMYQRKKAEKMSKTE